MANLRGRHNQFVRSTMVTPSHVVMRYGYEQMQDISVQGDGFASQTNEAKQICKVSSSSSLLKREGTFDLTPIDAFPVATDCKCLRSSASDLSEKKRSNSFDRSLAARFYSSQTGEPGIAPLTHESDEENDEALQLPVIFKTLSRFSSRQLNPLQAKSISRLAKGYHGRDKLTPEFASKFLEFLECESPAIQEAALITITRLVEKGKSNATLLLNHYSDVLDSILSLASDGPTLEVHLAALTVIEKMTKDEENISKWEHQLEDIIYPLVQAVVKNQDSSQTQKIGSLAILKNLAHSSVFAIRVKQDVVSQLMSTFDNSHMKGLYLSVLHETLQLSKQRVSADILDNSLLPVLTQMLADGPCETQRQSLRLLLYFVADEASRSSVLSHANTTAFCILCAKCSQCRKVRALSVKILEHFFSITAAIQARDFMQCTSDAWLLEGKKGNNPKPLIREDRVSSPIRKKSRAEAQLWRDFDKLITELVTLFEKEASIYHDNDKVTCEMSLIGSINHDQLTCISSLIGCFNKVCLWPLNRPRTAKSAIGEVPDRLTLDVLSVVSSLNRHHTMDIWQRTGRQLMSLFKKVLKRIPSSFSQSNTTSRPTSANTSRPPKPSQAWDMTTDDAHHQQSSPKIDEKVNESRQSNSEAKPEPLVLSFLFSQEEFTLLKNLTDFVLMMSLATCYFKTITPENEETQEGESQRGASRGNNEKSRKTELIEKEMLLDRKLLKCDLIEEGVMLLLGHLLSHDDSVIKVSCSVSLRMLLHPINDKISLGSKQTSYVSRNIMGKSRPQSAKARLEGSRRQTLSPRVFDMGRPGLGSRPQSSIPYLTSRTTPSSTRPSSSLSKTSQYILSDGPSQPPHRPGSAKIPAKLGQFSPLTPRSEQKPILLRTGEFAGLGSQDNPLPASGSLTERRPTSAKAFKNVSFNEKIIHMPDINKDEPLDAKLDPKGNVSLQCCHKALIVAGEATLKGISSPVLEVKKSCLLFLHDLVKYGTNEVHMELSKFGCISRLVDFLRINDDDELLEITGLIISRMLISSDRRLCQLFNRHGGTNVLMALLKKYPGSELNREACSTLNSVNNVLHQPLDNDETGEAQPHDVWGHIMQRWEEEDEVVKVLKQFIEKEN